MENGGIEEHARMVSEWSSHMNRWILNVRIYVVSTFCNTIPICYSIQTCKIAYCFMIDKHQPFITYKLFAAEQDSRKKIGPLMGSLDGKLHYNSPCTGSGQQIALLQNNVHNGQPLINTLSTHFWIVGHKKLKTCPSSPQITHDQSLSVEIRLRVTVSTEFDKSVFPYPKSIYSIRKHWCVSLWWNWYSQTSIYRTLLGS